MKHNWEIFFKDYKNSNTRAKHNTYKCLNCAAVYVVKKKDPFNENTLCKGGNFVYCNNEVKITNFYIAYMINGLYHRTDGPAIVYIKDITDKDQYWLNGEYYETVSSAEELLIKSIIE